METPSTQPVRKRSRLESKPFASPRKTPQNGSMASNSSSFSQSTSFSSSTFVPNSLKSLTHSPQECAALLADLLSLPISNVNLSGSTLNEYFNDKGSEFQDIDQRSHLLLDSPCPSSKPKRDSLVFLVLEHWQKLQQSAPSTSLFHGALYNLIQSKYPHQGIHLLDYVLPSFAAMDGNQSAATTIVCALANFVQTQRIPYLEKRMPFAAFTKMASLSKSSSLSFSSSSTSSSRIQDSHSSHFPVHWLMDLVQFVDKESSQNQSQNQSHSVLFWFMDILARLPATQMDEFMAQLCAASSANTLLPILAQHFVSNAKLDVLAALGSSLFAVISNHKSTHQLLRNHIDFISLYFKHVSFAHSQSELFNLTMQENSDLLPTLLDLLCTESDILNDSAAWFFDHVMPTLVQIIEQADDMDSSSCNRAKQLLAQLCDPSRWAQRLLLSSASSSPDTDDTTINGFSRFIQCLINLNDGMQSVLMDIWTTQWTRDPIQYRSAFPSVNLICQLIANADQLGPHPNLHQSCLSIFSHWASNVHSLQTSSSSSSSSSTSSAISQKSILILARCFLSTTVQHPLIHAMFVEWITYLDNSQMEVVVNLAILQLHPINVWKTQPIFNAFLSLLQFGVTQIANGEAPQQLSVILSSRIQQQLLTTACSDIPASQTIALLDLLTESLLCIQQAGIDDATLDFTAAQSLMLHENASVAASAHHFILLGLENQSSQNVIDCHFNLMQLLAQSEAITFDSGLICIETAQQLISFCSHRQQSLSIILKNHLEILSQIPTHSESKAVVASSLSRLVNIVFSIESETNQESNNAMDIEATSSSSSSSSSPSISPIESSFMSLCSTMLDGLEAKATTHSQIVIRKSQLELLLALIDHPKSRDFATHFETALINNPQPNSSSLSKLVQSCLQLMGEI